MAKPRVFISSTFYDLRQVRQDLDQFIMSLGYEPIRNEEGDIPYGKDAELEKYCYDEIKNCDILVSIIGGRLGSESVTGPYSISQIELKTALKENKQIYIFIENSVLAEYQTYLLNKGNDQIKYKYVDSSKIYEFIEEVNKLKVNNNIKAFESTTDITKYLKEQFAGLFKRFLDEQNKVKEANVIEQLFKTSQTLNQLVDVFSQKNEGKTDQLREILILNYPLLSFLQDKLHISYKFYINTLADLEALLSARGYVKCLNMTPLDDYYEWTNDNGGDGKVATLKIATSLFTGSEELLKYVNVNDWNSHFATYEVAEMRASDDLPF